MALYDGQTCLGIFPDQKTAADAISAKVTS
jgi:hypothetical protein